MSNSLVSSNGLGAKFPQLVDGRGMGSLPLLLAALPRRSLAKLATPLLLASSSSPTQALQADQAIPTRLRDAKVFKVNADTSSALKPSLLALDNNLLIPTLAQKKRAVFLGEHHNSAQDHFLQAEIIRELASNRRVAVGFESFQRRFQPVLDSYVQGRISEDELFHQTEWETRWFWPFERYLPIFRECRRQQINMIAMNVDSEDLSLVETGGLPALPASTLKLYIPDAEGFGNFARTLSFREYVAYVVQPSYQMHKRMGILRKDVSGNDMPFRNFLSGRLLWDEAMGSCAASWCANNPTGLFIGLIGSDHVKFGCGVPARCARQGIEGIASVMLNPLPIDTQADPTLIVDGAAKGQFSFADYTLQIRYDDNGVLPLADYLVFS